MTSGAGTGTGTGTGTTPAERAGRWAVVAGLALALIGVVLAVLPSGGASADVGTAPAADEDVTLVRAQLGGGGPSVSVPDPVLDAAPAPGPRSPVVEVDLPPVGVRVPAESVTSGADGVLLPPHEGTVGWWEGGASPTSTTGTVLLVGHVNTAGGGVGVFGRLDDLAPGSQVTVTTADGAVRPYVVEGRRSYRAENLPDELFAVEGPPRLALVTCALPYDERLERYTRTLVVWAEPAV